MFVSCLDSDIRIQKSSTIPDTSEYVKPSTISKFKNYYPAFKKKDKVYTMQ